MALSTLNTLPILGFCARCGGRGTFKAYAHVQGGVCFGCQGQGVKVYASEFFDWALADRADRIDVIRQALEMLDLCVSRPDVSGNIRARATAYATVMEVAHIARAAGDEDVFRRAVRALEARTAAPAPGPEGDDRGTDEGDREEAEEARAA